MYIAVIFEVLAVFECYSILGNSVTYRNIVEAWLRQNSGIVGAKGKIWGIVALGIVEA